MTDRNASWPKWHVENRDPSSRYWYLIQDTNFDLQGRRTSVRSDMTIFERWRPWLVHVRDRQEEMYIDFRFHTKEQAEAFAERTIEILRDIEGMAHD